MVDQFVGRVGGGAAARRAALLDVLELGLYPTVAIARFERGEVAAGADAMAQFVEFGAEFRPAALREALLGIAAGIDQGTPQFGGAGAVTARGQPRFEVPH